MSLSEQELMERHHHYYVTLERLRGNALSATEREEYEKAMKNERDGLVRPIPEEDDGATKPIERTNHTIRHKSLS